MTDARHDVVTGLGVSQSVVGRKNECQVLDDFLAAARRGDGGAVVVHGDPGIGKTALLDYAVASAKEFDVFRTVGNEAEMELPYAALHQLCRLGMGGVERLPELQRNALEVVLGRRHGAAPDQGLVGVALVSLFSALSSKRPLLCVVDDAQWLDISSAQLIAFAARRISKDAVAVLFGARTLTEEFRRLPELALSGLWYAGWATVELVEAASRTGNTEKTKPALEQLVDSTDASGSSWALGVQARCQALLSEGDQAEGLYQQAIEWLLPTRLRFDLARTRLLYGEWLRREQRPRDARAQLRTAHELFSEFGMDGFAQRARAELQATGEKVREHTVETRYDLTPQESRISELATQGATNQDIAAQMFISPATVEYHLCHVYRKLGIRSRTQLAHTLLHPKARRKGNSF